MSRMYGCGSKIVKSLRVTAKTLYPGNIDGNKAKAMARVAKFLCRNKRLTSGNGLSPIVAAHLKARTH